MENLKTPFVVNIEDETEDNNLFRNVRWTGKYLQLVYMSIKPDEKIDLEVHNNHDQFIRVEDGKGKIRMGETEDNLSFERDVEDDWAIFIPAGWWHEVINTGDEPLKIYTIYSPPEHEHGLQESYKPMFESFVSVINEEKEWIVYTLVDYKPKILSFSNSMKGAKISGGKIWNTNKYDNLSIKKTSEFESEFGDITKHKLDLL